MTRPLSETALRDVGRRAVRDAGSIRRYAEHHGLNAGLVSRWLLGQVPCPPAIAATLGYVRSVRYVPSTGGDR